MSTSQNEFPFYDFYYWYIIAIIIMSSYWTFRITCLSFLPYGVQYGGTTLFAVFNRLRWLIAYCNEAE